MICKKCGMEKKLMGFYNNYQDKLLPHILCKCPHYETLKKRKSEVPEYLKNECRTD